MMTVVKIAYIGIGSRKEDLQESDIDTSDHYDGADQLELWVEMEHIDKLVKSDFVSDKDHKELLLNSVETLIFY